MHGKRISRKQLTRKTAIFRLQLTENALEMSNFRILRDFIPRGDLALLPLSDSSFICKGETLYLIITTILDNLNKKSRPLFPYFVGARRGGLVKLVRYGFELRPGTSCSGQNAKFPQCLSPLDQLFRNIHQF